MAPRVHSLTPADRTSVGEASPKARSGARFLPIEGDTLGAGEKIGFDHDDASPAPACGQSRFQRSMRENPCLLRTGAIPWGLILDRPRPTASAEQRADQVQGFTLEVSERDLGSRCGLGLRPAQMACAAPLGASRCEGPRLRRAPLGFDLGRGRRLDRIQRFRHLRVNRRRC